MKAVKGAIVLATIMATVAVAACRREEHYEPMKLGGNSPATVQSVR
ncbi:MAG: hypothetical protein ACK5JT_10705 [Hyphomicrobiaceae bacterium]